jgi:hypothetical protein
MMQKREREREKERGHMPPPPPPSKKRAYTPRRPKLATQPLTRFFDFDLDDSLLPSRRTEEGGYKLRVAWMGHTALFDRCAWEELVLQIRQATGRGGPPPAPAWPPKAAVSFYGGAFVSASHIRQIVHSALGRQTRCAVGLCIMVEAMEAFCMDMQQVEDGYMGRVARIRTLMHATGAKAPWCIAHEAESVRLSTTETTTTATEEEEEEGRRLLAAFDVE